MKRLLTFRLQSCSYAALLMLFSAALHAGSVKFYNGSWQEAQQTAMEANKPLFVEIAPPNTQPLTDAVADNEVGDYLNNYFINYQMSINTRQGQEFWNKYGVGTGTNVIYFAPKGYVLSRFENVADKQGLLKTAKIALVKMNVPIEAMQRQYNKGYQSLTFLYDYAYQLKRYDYPYIGIVDKYIKKKKLTEDITSIDDFQFIYDFSDNIQTKAMEVMIAHESAFKKRYGEAHINAKIENAFVTATRSAAEKHDNKLFQKVCKLLTRSNMPKGDVFLLKLERIYYYAGNTSGIENLPIPLQSPYKDLEAAQWFAKAADLLAKNENKTTKQQQENRLLAIHWIEESIKTDPQYYNYETYAHLLYQIGSREQALVAAEKAVALGKLAGIDFSRSKELVEHLKAPTQDSAKLFDL